MKKLKSDYSEYKHYRSIVGICNPKNTTTYYEQNNIKVHPSWLGKDGFWQFLKDVGAKPSDKHKLFRIDKTKDYGPGNCEWLLSSSKQKNIIEITFRGETKTLVQWCKDLNLSYSSTYKKYKRGLSTVEIFKQPKKDKGKRLLYDGKIFTIKELCKKYNLNTERTYWRLRNGWEIKDVVEEPNQHKYPTRKNKNSFRSNEKQRMKKIKENNKRKNYKDSDSYRNYQFFSKKNS